MPHWRTFTSYCRGLLFIAALFLLGCGPRESSSPTLRYWNGFVGPDGNVTEPIVQQFKRQTGIHVEVQKMPWPIYFDKLIAAIASGNPPDLFVLHTSELVNYAAMGALRPLDELINRDDSFVPKADRIPQIWDQARYEGTSYGVPIDIHLLGLYYNKDYFDEARLPYPSPTQPLDGPQFFSIAQKLTEACNHEARPRVWAFTFCIPPYMYLPTLIWQFGGDLLTPDLRQAAVGSPESLASLHWLRDLVDRQISPVPEGLDAWQFFLQGRVAMFVSGSWVLNGLEKNATFRWGAAPMFRAGTQDAVWASGHILCLPRNLPPQRLTNALRLMKHLSDTGVQWSTSGYVPTRRSQLESTEFKRQARMGPFVAQLDHLRFEPPSPVLIELRDRYEQTLFTALSGIRPVEQAAALSQAQMNRILQRYYR